MTVKEYLQQIELYDMYIADKKQEREDLWREATGIGSALGKEQIQGAGGVSDKVGRYAIRLTRLDEDIDRLRAKREKRIELIKSLDKPLEVKVLYMRYVEYRDYPSLSVIAEEIGYSHQYITSIHGVALKKLKIPKSQ